MIRQSSFHSRSTLMLFIISHFGDSSKGGSSLLSGTTTLRFSSSEKVSDAGSHISVLAWAFANFKGRFISTFSIVEVGLLPASSKELTPP